MNTLTIAHLTMAFTTPVLINKISASADSDWPGGRAWNVIELLKVKYQPNNATAQVKLRLVLNSLKMGKNDNSSVLRDKIAAVENKFAGADLTVKPKDKVSAVLSGAPKKYTVTLTNMQAVKGDRAMDKDLITVMISQWHIKQAKKGLTDDNQGNTRNRALRRSICRNL